MTEGSVNVDVGYVPFNWRRRYNARQSDKVRDRSMDVGFGANDAHPNRLLLMAEPQVPRQGIEIAIKYINRSLRLVKPKPTFDSGNS